METDAETLGNVLLVVLTLLLVIGVGSLVLSAARSALNRSRCDFFFSYKSENANEVRRIAEHIMAAGYRVWFAEYEVFLRNYDDFESRIRKGIQNCSFAILFTTNSYSQSKHCRDEVKWLQHRFEKEPRRIIEVSLEEPNDAHQALDFSSESPRLTSNLSPHVSRRHSEEHNLLTRLSTLTGLNLNLGSKIPQLGGSSSRFRARCAPISFDPSGFVLKEWKAHPVDGTDIVTFEGEPGPVYYSFNVYFHYSPQKAPGELFTMGADPLDDRMLYKELRAYASGYMKQMRARGVFLKERGLHLIWIDGRTHIGLTQSFLWMRMRKYSVILSQLTPPIQLIFTFGVTGSFADFCRFVPLMDRVIESVSVEI